MIGVQRLHQLWSHLGSDWVAYRLGYAVKLRTGAIRRKLPSASWDDETLAALLTDSLLAEPSEYLDYRKRGSPRFFFSSLSRDEFRRMVPEWDKQGSQALERADEIAAGYLRYFHRTVAHTGFPPGWHSNPFTCELPPSDRHWSEIGDFDHGDIKIIWEPSRFGLAYALVRAYWRTGVEKYAEAFWQAVEDWRDKNPPQTGSNWKCGQEVSIRVMAWCFALYGLLDSPATTARRVAMLGQMISVSGRRIDSNFEYALNQKNNHGISEATGLFTIGTLFPEFKEAERWRARGSEALENQGRELIYDDGAFAQHSLNYHRLMLHDYLWSMRLAELQKNPFSEELKRRVAAASDFLYQIQDEKTGRAPCYGQNDGSLILRLNDCEFDDFRPVIQATSYLTGGRRRYDSGPWDEDLIWLFGAEALGAPVDKRERADLRAGIGGYYTVRSDLGVAFVRAATFRHRPSQADMLHVDLWWRGINVALDAGTFSYNAPEPWNNSLSRTAYHNTVSVDDCDQMDQAGKFLWLPWLTSRSTSIKKSAGGGLAYWEGEHDGYKRLKLPASHRRGILRIGDDTWLIVDSLQSRGPHLYRLHWLLCDTEFEWDESIGQVALHTSAGDYSVRVLGLSGNQTASLVRADDSSPRGWRAPSYNCREPALSLAAEAISEAHVFLSLFGPECCAISTSESVVVVTAESWSARIVLSNEGDATLVRQVALSGGVEERMELA